MIKLNRLKIFSVLFLLNFSEMLVAADSEDEPQDLKGKILKGCSRAQEAKNKDITFLIGVTGAAKSTTAAYLMGAKIKRDIVNGQPAAVIDMVVGDTKSYPKIGYNTTDSETLYPQICDSQPPGQFLCDLPGLFDTRSLDERIAISVSIESAIRMANTRKIVIVVSYDQLTAERGEVFKNVVSLFGRMLKNPDRISDSILWLFTKVPPGIQVHHIIENIRGREDRVTGQYSGGMLPFFVKKAHNLIKSIAEFRTGNVQGMMHAVSGLLNSEEDVQRGERELKDLEQQGKVLRMISERNLLVVDHFTENSRIEISERLKRISDISVDEFNFEQDEPRKRFEEFAYGVANEGLELRDRKSQLLQEIKNIDEKIRQISERIETCNSGEGGDTEAQETLLRRYRGSVKSNETTSELNEKRKQLLESVLDKIDTEEEESLFSSEFALDFSEDHSGAFDWGRSIKEFRHSGDQFTRAVLTKDDHGNIVSLDNRPGEGIYSIKYEGARGKSSWVKLQLLVKKQDKRDNKILINRTRKELEKIENQRVIFELEKTRLEEKLFSLSQSKVSSKWFSEEKKRLMDESKTLSDTLQEKSSLLPEIDEKIEQMKPMFVSVDQIMSVMPFSSKSDLIKKFQGTISDLYPGLVSSASKKVPASNAKERKQKPKRERENPDYQ